MKPLVFVLKQEPDQRLDLAPLVPHLLDGKSVKDIAQIELQTTRETITVGDIFKYAPAARNRSGSRADQFASTISAWI